MKCFDHGELESIAKILGNTQEGLTGSEIARLLIISKIPDVDPSATKWIRIFNAFCSKQNSVKDPTNILEFIKQAMKPSRHIGSKEYLDEFRSRLNVALAFSGLEVDETGELQNCKKTLTLTDAEYKADQLKLRLAERDIHLDVLRFCRAELLQKNYFHAVLEAVKSVFDKLRKISSLTHDGHELANKCFTGDNPLLRINAYTTKSEKIEQTGFNELIKAVYSMFRNPISHEAKINWEITQRDAEDLLTIVSMIHRRLDMSSNR